MAITLLENRTRYGEVRYFRSDRCFQTEGLLRFHQGKLLAEELVTFDCGLMEMQEIVKEEIPKKIPEGQQMLAVIFRPGIEIDALLEREGAFTFCGYDLVEEMAYISSITNCGARFERAIPYQRLNQVGLFASYKEAVLAQLALYEEYPEETHAYCEIVEIWRMV